MESTLAACSSCQRYLEALIAFAKSEGKTITITYYAHPEASTMTRALNIIAKQENGNKIFNTTE